LDSNELKSRMHAELRRKAEERVREIEEGTGAPPSDADTIALLHELHVNQIELEMQNEELLRARGEVEAALVKYTDLYDFAPIGYLTLDAKGRILESNLAATELLGMPSSELLGADFRFLVVRQSLSMFNEFLARVLESDQKQSCELRLRSGREPGWHVRVQGKSAQSPEDGPMQCRMAMIDISEGRLFQDMLTTSRDELGVRASELAQAREESERRAAELQSMLAGMVDGVMQTDAEGGVIYVNDACIEILEAPSTEAFEDWSSRFELYTLDGEPLPYEESACARALAGETVRNTHVRGVTPWGKALTMSISASPVRDAEGRVFGATLVFHDISVRIEFERLRQELLEREHHIAEMLQQAIVPRQRQFAFPGCRISVEYQAAFREAEIGGDFYDVFELGEGKIGILIGDIAGKGLAAAIQVAAARHIIRSYALLDLSPARVMTLANEALCKGQSEADSMLTAFFTVLDTRQGRMESCCAGHEPPFVRSRSGEVVDLECEGRALGIISGFDYPQSTYTLQRGDVVLMLTDGITEALCRQREFFGREGVAAYLEQSHGASLEDIASGLLDAATSFASGSLRDDAAIIVLELTDADSV
jgi:PAS domain S-box-containing protein